MTPQWFLSKTVRQATALRKHVQRILNHQRDILSSQAVQAVGAAAAELQKTATDNPGHEELAKPMANLETVANKWLKPYPNAAWRENIEVLLVALAVAMGIRTFFLQPVQIPTGSMQPTLYGVTSVPDFTRSVEEPGVELPTQVEIPPLGERIKQWFQ